MLAFFSSESTVTLFAAALLPPMRTARSPALSVLCLRMICPAGAFGRCNHFKPTAMRPLATIGVFVPFSEGPELEDG